MYPALCAPMLPALHVIRLFFYCLDSVVFIDAFLFASFPPKYFRERGGVLIMDDFRDAMSLPRRIGDVDDDADTSSKLGGVVAILSLGCFIGIHWLDFFEIFFLALWSKSPSAV